MCFKQNTLHDYVANHQLYLYIVIYIIIFTPLFTPLELLHIFTITITNFSLFWEIFVTDQDQVSHSSEQE